MPTSDDRQVKNGKGWMTIWHHPWLFLVGLILIIFLMILVVSTYININYDPHPELFATVDSLSTSVDQLRTQTAK